MRGQEQMLNMGSRLQGGKITGCACKCLSPSFFYIINCIKPTYSTVFRSSRFSFYSAILQKLQS